MGNALVVDRPTITASTSSIKMQYLMVNQRQHVKLHRGSSIGSFGANPCCIVCIVSDREVFLAHVDHTQKSTDQTSLQLELEHVCTQSGAVAHLTTQNGNSASSFVRDWIPEGVEVKLHHTASLVVMADGSVQCDVPPPTDLNTDYMDKMTSDMLSKSRSVINKYDAAIASGKVRPEAPGPNYYCSTDQWKWIKY